MNLKINLLLIALIAIGTTAQAQHGRRGQRPSPEDILSRIDSNGDGYIDREEAAQAPKGKLSEHFEQIDVSQDDLISLEEMKAFAEENKGHQRGQGGKKSQKKGKMLEQLDSDGNGELSLGEIEASGKQRLIDQFDTIDTDGNGSLTKEELKAFKKARRKG